MGWSSVGSILGASDSRHFGVWGLDRDFRYAYGQHR